jgi:hypothetical protein
VLVPRQNVIHEGGRRIDNCSSLIELSGHFESLFSRRVFQSSKSDAPDHQGGRHRMSPLMARASEKIDEKVKAAIDFADKGYVGDASRAH